MSFILWTAVIGILFYIYKFQLSDMSKGAAYFMATLEVTILSFLLMSTSSPLVFMGVIAAVLCYFLNSHLQSFLQG